MLESFRQRFSSKDKKINTFIEPKAGWGMVVNGVKKASMKRAESFLRISPENNLQIGEFGYAIFTQESYYFSSEAPMEQILYEFAVWTFYGLSSDHSLELPQFEFKDVSDTEVVQEMFYLLTYRTNINENWDLRIMKPLLDYPEQHFMLELLPKFTEADRK